MWPRAEGAVLLQVEVWMDMKKSRARTHVHPDEVR